MNVEEYFEKQLQEVDNAMRNTLQARQTLIMDNDIYASEILKLKNELSLECSRERYMQTNADLEVVGGQETKVDAIYYWQSEKQYKQIK